MKKYILYIVAILAGTSVSAPVFAETMKNKVDIKPSMTLDVPVSSINLNLDPATNAFASEDVNITVGTNNKTGYWISMSSATSGSDLVNIDDNTKTIPTITTAGSYTSSDFPINQWGYKIDSGNYTPFVSGATIKSSNTTANGETFKLNIASKIDYLQPSGTYNIALNIKMLPNMTTNYIQNLDPTLCTEDPMVVIDNRDEQPYIVQRLKDGKCWMMTNLNLGAVKLTQDLTSANTNIATVVTAEEFNGWEVLTGTVTYVDGEYSIANGVDPISLTPYGVMYNYCATTAGTYCYSSTENKGDAIYDICPAGWRIPTGNTSGEFARLYAEYDSYDKMRAPMSNNGAAFNMAGYVHDTTPDTHSGGWTGHFWSSTVADRNGYMYGLRLRATLQLVDLGVAYTRGDGFTVRCLLKES